MPTAKREYDWQRFWYPRGDTPDLSDGGYLRDPEHLVFPYYASNVVTWDQIKDTPCLVLLGEPGSGKSHALRKTEETTRLDFQVLSHFSDLAECPLESLDDQVLIDWRNGDQDLTLFLDSLDEGMALDSSLVGYLTKRLRAWPSQRFRLRIACRTEVWPLGLEETLEEIFGPSRIKVYQLAPLRRVDILQAAKGNGLDCDRFIDEIDRCNAVSLAIRPITLELLLRIYNSRQGRLTSDMIKLYEGGCKRLCGEPSQRQRDLGFGTTSEDDCMTIAGYVATLLILTGNGLLWTGGATDDIPEGCITISRIIGATGQIECPDPLVSYDSVQKIRKTSLFTSHGPNCVGFSHQTYAEFLAARYLHDHLSSRQIISLISCTDRYGEAIIPQLRSMIPWLANLMPEIWEYAFQVDPLLLIDSDMLSRTDSDRARLVSTLLDQSKKDFSPEIRARYPNLAHPGLADQLRSYVNDSDIPFRARREALLLIKACQVRDLQDDLVARAFDKTENDDIRWLATWALAQIGDVSTKSRLKPLALGQDPTDQNENVRGWALRATWHVCVTSEELFASITPPQSEGRLLAYQWFIEFELAPTLTSSDLLPALEWVQEVACSSQVPHSLHVLADAIILMAWDHMMEEPVILNLMARITVSRAERHIDFADAKLGARFASLIETDEHGCHALIAAVVAAVSLSHADRGTLARDLGPNLIARDRDLDWLLEQACAHTGTAEAQQWAILVSDALSCNNEAQVSRVYRTVASIQQAAGPVAQWLEDTLAQIDVGSDDAWVELASALEKLRYTREIIDDSLQARITAASLGFIHQTHASFVSSELLNNTKMVRAVICFLRWISANSVTDLDRISEQCWRDLAPVIFAYHDFGSGDEELYATVLPKVYRYAPTECIEALKRQICSDSGIGATPATLELLRPIWDTRVALVLLHALTNGGFGPESSARALDLLLENHQPDAFDAACSLLEAPGSMRPSFYARSYGMAGILLRYVDESTWDRLWRTLGADLRFFLEAISVCAVTLKGEEMLYASANHLSATQISELYVWLFRHFPGAKDALFNPGSQPPMSKVFYWREALLRRLMQSGSWEACAVIEHIKMEICDLERLSIVLDQAIVSARQMAWKPPRPADIIRLLSSKSTRYIQDGMQLLEMVIESLKRLDARLHDEIPAVHFLWNEDKNGYQRPKEEASLSDYVTLHLRELVDRGIVVNREVQIHRGERTDIHVDTISGDQDGQTYDRISVIIEVKGCWNRDLESAMEEQLLNHYLKDSACRYGIYLIGWFKCGQWDKEDYRKGDTPTYGLEEARQRFSSQAEALSSEITIRAVVLDTSLH